jgi:hypothetical protein
MSKYITLTAEVLSTKNKNQLAIHVMRNIQSDVEVLEKDRTAIFKRIMMDHGLSEKGCYTYARNARIHLSGGDMFESNKKWNKKKLESDRAKKVTEEIGRLISKNVEPIVEVVTQDVVQTVELNRWRVVDKETNEIVNSFVSRSAAQEFNKKLKESGQNTTWVDGLKTA